MPKKILINEDIKICVVFPNIFPIIGGLENLVYDFINSLSDKVQVQVVCTGIGDIYIPPKVKVYPILKQFRFKFPGSKYLCFLVNITFDWLYLYKFLREHKPEIVHTFPAFPGCIISLPAKLLDIPIVGTSMGADIQINQEVGYGIRRNKIVSKLVKMTLKYLSIHTVTSNDMIREAIDAGSDRSKIRVIYNGINIDKIRSGGGSDILQKNNISKDNFVILYLSRLHPKKCPQDLLKAFPMVANKVPNAKLIFAGDGEELPILKKMVSEFNLEDKVVFTGFVSGDKKSDLLNRCDIFVLPSLVEGHPVATIEAMAYGKPVIATNLGPFPEIIKDGVTGVLVPPHSPDDLSNAIIELAINDKKRKEMGEKARRDVETRFDINKVSNDYLNIYKELIE